jgi:thiamine pyrophosphokinase
MKVVIVCGGKPPIKNLLKSECKNAKFLICADSGANCVYEYNMKPDFLVGDFDSINSEVLEYYKGENTNMETYPAEKDDTDSEIAIQKAAELGASEIVLLGATGNRLDHIFGNIGLLKISMEKGIKAKLIDEYNELCLVNKSTVIKGKYGEIFSLQAYGSKVTNLSIKGAKYPLVGYTLEMGDPITISNEFLKDDVLIEFDEGTLMIFYSKDR